MKGGALASPLPTTFALVAGHAKGNYVVEVVCLVVVKSVSGQVAFDPTALNVEAEAVPTIRADFPELCLEPLSGDEVGGNLSAVLAVLLFVVLHLFVEVLVENPVVNVVYRSRVKDYVLKLGGSGDGCVNPLPVRAPQPPVEDRNLFADRGALEGVASTTVAVDEVFLNLVQLEFANSLGTKFLDVDRWTFYALDDVLEVHVELGTF